MALQLDIGHSTETDTTVVAEERSGCHDCTNPACKRRLAIDFEMDGDGVGIDDAVTALRDRAN